MNGQMPILALRGKGRRLSEAVFKLLALEGCASAYDAWKREGGKVSYGAINMKLRKLEKEGYIKFVGTKEATKAGEVRLYKLSFKGSLATSLLIDDKDPSQVRAFIKNTEDINPLSKLGVILLEAGVDINIVAKLTAKVIRYAIMGEQIHVDHEVMQVFDPLLSLEYSHPNYCKLLFSFWRSVFELPTNELREVASALERKRDVLERLNTQAYALAQLELAICAPPIELILKPTDLASRIIGLSPFSKEFQEGVREEMRVVAKNVFVRLCLEKGLPHERVENILKEIETQAEFLGLIMKQVVAAKK